MDWLIDWLIYAVILIRSIIRSNDWLIDWFTQLFFIRLIIWLIDWLIDWLIFVCLFILLFSDAYSFNFPFFSCSLFGGCQRRSSMHSLSWFDCEFREDHPGGLLQSDPVAVPAVHHLGPGQVQNRRRRLPGQFGAERVSLLHEWIHAAPAVQTKTGRIFVQVPSKSAAVQNIPHRLSSKMSIFHTNILTSYIHLYQH